MEIDDKLKNRLAGTTVVTVLAIIFLPMLFDSPADKKAQVVSELDIPHKPEVSPLLTTAIVPDTPVAVTTKAKPVANAVSESSETVVEASEKIQADSETEKAPQNSESAAVTVENKTPVIENKKIDKKPVAQGTTAIAEGEALEKPAKSELPSLPKPAVDKNEVNKSSPPSLDSAPVAEKHRWVVQVASLSDETKANAFRDKLRSQGFPAIVDPVWLKGKGRVYRLKVGPELDAEKAKAMKNKINQLNNVSSIAIAE